MAVHRALIVCQLEGDVEFVVGPDPTRYRVERYDLLYLPCDVIYEYLNVGRNDALLFMTNGRLGDWPRESVYFLPGQEQPFTYKHLHQTARAHEHPGFSPTQEARSARLETG